MSKSNQELTAEIVVAYLSMRSGENKAPVKQDELLSLIRAVYDTIKTLL